MKLYLYYLYEKLNCRSFYFQIILITYYSKYIDFFYFIWELAFIMSVMFRNPLTI